MSKLKRSIVHDLNASTDFDREVLIKGWIRTRRGSKKFSFIEVNDGSSVRGIQVVIDHSILSEDTLRDMNNGAGVAITGLLVASQGQGQSCEIQAKELTIYGAAPQEDYPLQKKGHSMEKIREIAHLRPRTRFFGAVLRLRGAVSYAIHQFFYDKGFQYLHSPIITGSDAEGAGEMFQVTTMPWDNTPRNDDATPDFSQDFFHKKAHLTVSGQLEAELAALALSNVYTFGPTFRAENSNTARHLAEFWMIEPEMAFYDITDNMDLAEEFCRYILKFVLDNNEGDIDYLDEQSDESLKTKLQEVAGTDFVRITYTEAIDILEKSGQSWEFPVSWGVDLQSEHERYLVEQHFRKPVIVTAYPKDIKSFYMRMNDDGKTVAAMDILFPGIGEVVGGSQREERLDVLTARIHEMGLPIDHYWWYLDTRKFGTVPHSGFGLGLERLLLFITGMKNIRDVIPFPRTPGNLEF